MHHRLTLLLALALLVALLPAHPAAGAAPPAQELSGLSLRATAGYDGFYREGFWLPITVEVSNDGAPIEGALRAYPATDPEALPSTAPISLPTQSSKRVTLYAYAHSFPREFVVELVDGRGRALTSVLTNRLQRVDERNERLYGVVSDNAGFLDLLEDVPAGRSGAQVAYLALADLPELPVAWQAFDLLVFNEVDSGQLTTGQRAALEGWIELGGVLVVTGGPGWQRTSAALLDLLPATPSDTVSIADVPALRAVSGVDFRDAGPYLVTESRLRSGRLLLFEGERPLVAVGGRGNGHVVFLALDPQLPPLTDWRGSADLWRLIAGLITTRPSWARPFSNHFSAASSVGNLPGVTLPSTGLLFGFLLVYVVVIGPLNYIVLKRLGRRELAWLTIPALVLLFSGGAYVVGSGARGRQPIVNQMAVATGAVGGDDLLVHSIVGLYSPRRAGYDLVLPADAAARPFTRSGSADAGRRYAGLEQGRDFVVRDVRVDIAGLATFYADSVRPGPAVTGQAILHVENGALRLSLSLQNNSGVDLADLNLIVGAQQVQIGDLPAGGALQHEEPINLVSAPAPGTGAFAPRPGTFLNSDTLVGSSRFRDPAVIGRFELVDALLQNGDFSFALNPASSKVYVSAWSDAPALEVDVAGQTSEKMATTLYFLAVPVEVALERGEAITFPNFMIERRFAALAGGASVNGEVLSLPEESAIEVLFRPQGDLELVRVSGLELLYQAEVGSIFSAADAFFEAYEWAEQAWQPLAVTGVRSPLPDPERFVGPDNVVRLRLRNDALQRLEISNLTLVYRGEAR